MWMLPTSGARDLDRLTHCETTSSAKHESLKTCLGSNQGIANTLIRAHVDTDFHKPVFGWPRVEDSTSHDRRLSHTSHEFRVDFSAGSLVHNY
jgi:hypothetical protein